MTHNNPVFRYHISGIPGDFTRESPLWNTPLAGEESHPSSPDRQKLCNNASDIEHLPLMIHEYLGAAEQFLKSDNFKVLIDAVNFSRPRQACHDATKQATPCSMEPHHIEQVDIFLEKHGAFYHPARVELSLNCQPNRVLALNGAAAQPGLSLIHREYTLLDRLNRQDKPQVIPRVFGMGSVSCREVEISFFLAEWFEGYKEFHLTHDDVSSCDILHLWDGDGSVTPYSPPHYFEIYEKASEILTVFYNIRTFEQIFPWHHAAGDFIAKPTEKGFDVRLITVRGYASMLDQHGGGEQNIDPDDINKALLIFFLNLSLRMRIDRRNGTGDYCLVHPDVIDFILRGFFRALQQKKESHFPEEGDLVSAFASYLQQFDHAGLHSILGMIIDAGNPDSPETAFIRANLDSHSKILSQKIHEPGKNWLFY